MDANLIGRLAKDIQLLRDQNPTISQQVLQSLINGNSAQSVLNQFASEETRREALISRVVSQSRRVG